MSKISIIMFLHIKSLIHKIHPYFSQYAAYLRNMRITKNEDLVSTTESLKLKLCDNDVSSSLQCFHQFGNLLCEASCYFLYERYNSLLIYWRPELI